MTREITLFKQEAFNLDSYTHFEHLSVTGGVGIVVLDTNGHTLFESSVHIAMSF